jgi:hypothetical protein
MLHGVAGLPNLVVRLFRAVSEGLPRPIDLDEAKVRAARKLHDDRTLNIDDICNTLHISRSTYYRYIRIEVRK